MEGIFIGVLCLSGCLTFSTCLLHQYHFVSNAKTWTEAQSYCREKYTDLATIENTEEMKKLKDTVSAAGNSSEVWIGLYSHIDWKWSDGFNQSGAECRSWHRNQPNNFNGNQFCVAVTYVGELYDFFCNRKMIFFCYRDLEQGGNWRLCSCEERKPFVCYSITTVKTLVKMRVKLEDSSLDLNDPAVKQQILKQLQDRLKENGLSGVTLKWKEQADGKVFHKEEKGSDKKKKTEL
ncbi:C-type lectin lectoxin-Phi1 isoform X2 [Pleuronectes platessa]|uniref:C-type lectin lectoxin-Phi1 isoform X2 n=1 Tax=Pleuronectes platessa TaxID=8262 RepID=UPI00232A342C|nr:C-type lectin lectoxin-Phi1 isoform X2 [Pleuronectes platessa]